MKSIPKKYFHGSQLTPIVLAVLLITASFHHYLLFHTLAEFFAITVGFMMFAVAWNTFKLSRNHFLMFIAGGYFWVASLDVVHTLIYKGMMILPVETANPATQFWLVARLLEAGVLLAAPWFLTHPVHRHKAFFILGIISLLASALIATGHFPAAYQTSTGLTPFKVFIEWIIIALLGLAALHLYQKRNRLPRRTLWLLLSSIVLTMCAEYVFTMYDTVYDLTNLIGHLFKLFSFWLLFVAIVRDTLVNPFESLRLSEHRYRSAMDDIPEIISWRKDRNFYYLSCNSNYAKALSIQPEEIVGKTDFDFYATSLAEKYRADDAVVLKELRPLRLEESFSTRHEDRCIYSVKMPVINEEGVCTGIQGIALDISDQKRARALERRADYDALTGLANRRTLFEWLEKTLTATRRSDQIGAIFFVDLDLFKFVNDNHGHQNGDKVLEQVAQRLESQCRHSDLCARYGGDEFVLILQQMGTTEQEARDLASIMAHKILASMGDRAFQLDDRDIHLDASIGICTYPKASMKAVDLIGAADAAMYQAKGSGSGQFYFA